MNKIYFADNDGNLIDSYEVKKAARIIMGKEPKSNQEIRHFAKMCGGIAHEIKHPSVKYLLERGNKVRAVMVYRDLHNVSLKEAKEAVEEIEKNIH